MAAYSRILSTTPLMLAIAAGAAYSQEQQQAPSQRYAVVLYMKVPPAQEAAYIEHYKTGFGAKALRAVQKANPNITGWSLRQVLYPGENAPAANFVHITTMTGPPRPPDPAKRDETYRAATGMTYSQYLQKVSAMGERMGSALMHVHETTPGFQLDEGDVITARRLKTAAGKGQDLTRAIRTMRLPIVTERTKTGSLKGYVFSHSAIGGGGSAWDASETWVHKDLASAISIAPPTAGGSMKEIFAKVHPGKDLAEFTKMMNELAATVRTDVYRVAVVIRPEGTTIRSSTQD